MWRTLGWPVRQWRPLQGTAAVVTLPLSDDPAEIPFSDSTQLQGGDRQHGVFPPAVPLLPRRE